MNKNTDFSSIGNGIIMLALLACIIAIILNFAYESDYKKETLNYYKTIENRLLILENEVDSLKTIQYGN